MARVAFDILLFISVFIFPWWSVALFVIVGSVVFPFFFEAPLSGIMLDALFGYIGAPVLGVPILYTLIFTFISLTMHFFRARIRQKVL